MEPAPNRVPLKQNEWYLEPAYPGVVCKDYPGDVVKVGLRANNLLLERVSREERVLRVCLTRGKWPLGRQKRSNFFRGAAPLHPAEKHCSLYKLFPVHI